MLFFTFFRADGAQGSGGGMDRGLISIRYRAVLIHMRHLVNFNEFLIDFGFSILGRGDYNQGVHNTLCHLIRFIRSNFEQIEFLQVLADYHAECFDRGI